MEECGLSDGKVGECDADESVIQRFTNMKYLLSTMFLLFASAAAFGQSPPSPAGSLDSAPRITVKEAKQAYNKNKAVFVDDRAKDQYDLEHIKGAINVPLPDDANSAALKSLPKNKLIIVYCSCLMEHTSARFVLDMRNKGYTNIRALLGGLDAWKKAGLPIER